MSEQRSNGKQRSVAFVKWEGDKPSAKSMPWPDVVVIEPSEGNFYLHGFTAEGDSTGDTWHRSRKQAKRHAEEEFGARLGAWRTESSSRSLANLVRHLFEMRE